MSHTIYIDVTFYTSDCNMLNCTNDTTFNYVCPDVKISMHRQRRDFVTRIKVQIHTRNSSMLHAWQFDDRDMSDIYFPHSVSLSNSISIQPSVLVFCLFFLFLPLLFDCIYLFTVLYIAVYVFVLSCAVLFGLMITRLNKHHDYVLRLRLLRLRRRQRQRLRLLRRRQRRRLLLITVFHRSACTCILATLTV